jgi:hypothetical protein
MTPKPSVMRLQLDAESKNHLDAVCRKRGMTQIALMSRLVSWFTRQDDYMQTSVLHPLSEGTLAAMAKSAIKKL